MGRNIYPKDDTCPIPLVNNPQSPSAIPQSIEPPNWLGTPTSTIPNALNPRTSSPPNMAPPGRLLLLLATFLTPLTQAAVLGLDFGTLNLKAALVKPGIPLEIVLSKDSKRKETAAVAFKASRDSVPVLGSFPERAYGGDALALQGRFPGEVFPNLKPLLGLSMSDEDDEAVGLYTSRFPAVKARKVKEMGTTMVQSTAFVGEEPPWSIEELLAMELANIKGNAEALAGKGSSVRDAVITVPAFYTADERRAILRAADLAGLSVQSLITDGVAVGLDYAKSRTFPDVTAGGKPEHHVVFDMGAGSTTATLLRFQGRSVKDVGRFNKTVQEATVLGIGWDRTLGGDALNQVVLDDYVYKFMTKPVMKSRGTPVEEIKGNGRVMARLWREAEKTRQVLSANTETSSSFEELLPDIDFRSKLSRTEFESLTESFAARVAKPIEDALAAAKISIKDIDSIIVHGGATRTPFVQKQLELIAGGTKKLKSNVNADESAVFGAAFKGAGLSPSFKVKEIRDSDVAGYPAGMTWTDGGKERRQGLFGVASPVGFGSVGKLVNFKNKEDFSFTLFQTVEGTDRPVSRVVTENLTAGVKELETLFGCKEKDVSTKFSIKLSNLDGLPEVLSGSVSCETDAVVAKSGNLVDSAKDWLGFGKKKEEQEPLGEDDIVEEVDASTSTTSTSSSKASKGSSSSSSSTSKIPEKPKKRIESIPIKFSTMPRGNAQPAPTELKRMRDRLAAFDRSDKARLAREEALNVLESYTYHVRDFLDNSDYVSVSTSAQRDGISSLLDTTREFMDSAAAGAKEEVLREKLAGLKKLVEPIQARRREEIARPKKVQGLREGLEKTGGFMETVRKQVGEAREAEKKASSYEAEQSSSSASAAASSTSIVENAEVEDADEAATTTTSTESAAPKYSSPASFAAYTDLDLADLETVYTSVEKWLKEKLATQASLKPHEEPVLLVKDIEAKAAQLSQVMTDLVYKKMQRSSSSSSSAASSTRKAKATKSKKSKSAKSSSGSSTTSAPDGSATALEDMPNVFTVGAEGGMPSEEEIRRMVEKAREGRERDEL